MKKNYKVIVLNMGEELETLHYHKTIKQIKKQYNLEKLEIVSIEEIN